MDVGVEHRFIEDGDRSSVASYPSRTIAISIFFPASRDAVSREMMYVDLFKPSIKPALDTILSGTHLSEGEKGRVIEDSMKIGTGCYESAELLSGQDPYPLLLYSPTGNGNRFSNLPVLKQIVLSGYVVVSIDHPHEGFLITYPSGHLCMEIADEDDFIKMTKDRVVDAQKVLDFIFGSNFPEALANAVNLDAIGMFGHSRGGYVSTLADAEDDRIKTMGNIDGFLYAYMTDDGTSGINRWPESTQRNLRSSLSPMLRIKGRPNLDRIAQQFADNAKDFNGEFNFVIFKGWNHNDFSTASYLAANSGAKEVNSLISFPPKERAERLGAVIVEFFDIYLKGKDCRKLLLAENQSHVMFRKKRGEQDSPGNVD